MGWRGVRASDSGPFRSIVQFRCLACLRAQAPGRSGLMHRRRHTPWSFRNARNSVQQRRRQRRPVRLRAADHPRPALPRRRLAARHLGRRLHPVRFLRLLRRSRHPGRRGLRPGHGRRRVRERELPALGGKREGAAGLRGGSAGDLGRPHPRAGDALLRRPAHERHPQGLGRALAVAAQPLGAGASPRRHRPRRPAQVQKPERAAGAAFGRLHLCFRLRRRRGARAQAGAGRGAVRWVRHRRPGDGLPQPPDLLQGGARARGSPPADRLHAPGAGPGGQGGRGQGG